MATEEIPGFDALLVIAQEDPGQLDKLLEQLTQSTIESAPTYLRPRLRGLQFQIDATCAIARTPLASCVRLSNMMHQSIESLQQAFNRNSRLRDPTQTTQAKILNFPDQHHSHDL